MKDRILTWLTNSSTTHHRWMANYLRKRGWVTFYLEKEARFCHDTCWLRLYENDSST